MIRAISLPNKEHMGNPKINIKIKTNIKQAIVCLMFNVTNREYLNKNFTFIDVHNYIESLGLIATT